MTERKKIRFVANPRSGAVRRRNLPHLIEKNLDHDLYDAELCFTQYAGHGAQLTKAAVDQGVYMVVACGGDGSVNEVASQLIHTGTILGMVPCGSGNGFAGYLGLGRDVAGAIRLLNDGKVISVDSCLLNGRPFVNLAGIGFDGVVSMRLRNSPVRGLWAYLRYTLEEIWAYKMQQLDIQVDGQKTSRCCLLVEVANAPDFGYGFSIVPQAILNDGLLEVLVVKAAPKWRYFLEGWRFLNRSFHRSSLCECFSCREVVVTPSTPTCFHLDGEGYELTGEARFSIVPNSLRLMVPQAFAENLHRA